LQLWERNFDRQRFGAEQVAAAIPCSKPPVDFSSPPAIAESETKKRRQIETSDPIR
jgi:hypothetical protein